MSGRDFIPQNTPTLRNQRIWLVDDKGQGDVTILCDWIQLFDGWVRFEDNLDTGEGPQILPAHRVSKIEQDYPDGKPRY